MGKVIRNFGRLFRLGRKRIEPDAARALQETHTRPVGVLAKHQRGDWGVSDNPNELALRDGGALVSIYELSDGNSIRIRTDPDRSETTISLVSYARPDGHSAGR